MDIALYVRLAITSGRHRLPVAAAPLLLGGLLLCGAWSCTSGNSGSKGISRIPDAIGVSSGWTVTVRPIEIDDILYNPGMGFADFPSRSGVHCHPASILVRPSPTFAGTGPISSLSKGNMTSVASTA